VKLEYLEKVDATKTRRFNSYAKNFQTVQESILQIVSAESFIKLLTYFLKNITFILLVYRYLVQNLAEKMPRNFGQKFWPEQSGKIDSRTPSSRTEDHGHEITRERR
jgi:type I restriction-modification system DNA methylase subunit